MLSWVRDGIGPGEHMKTMVACLIIISLVANFPVGISEDRAVEDTGPAFDLQALAGNLFTRNNGQIPHPEVVFHSSNAYFTPTGVIFRVIERTADGCPAFLPGPPMDGPDMDAPVKMHIFSTTFAGANRVIPYGREELPHRSNFFIGNDSEKWRTDVPNFKTIVYENLYDGIDLVYRAVPDGLKYDFMVHPGADASDIRIRYEGVGVRTDSQNIFIDTTAGLVVDGGLKAFQPDKGSDEPVDARIIVEGDTVSFDVGYDSSRELVVDPLIFSTFLGGSSMEYGGGLVVDPSDNPIVAGYSWSNDFPTTPGAYQTTMSGIDIFVTKLNSSGDSLLYSTYVGGWTTDQAYSVAIDSSNNTVVAGYTFSNDFPTTAGAYDRSYASDLDLVVFKLNPKGDGLIFSTYIGGMGQDATGSLALDSEDSIFVTGGTFSSDFPVTSGAYDTVKNGGANEAFIVKLNSGGDTLLFATFFGMGGRDWGSSIDVDSDGAAYVAGTTEGSITTTPTAFDPYYNGGGDIFAIKLSPDGKSLKYSTYIGGSSSESPASITVDSSDNALICGATSSSDFPTTPGAYNRTLQGWNDGFLLALKPEGTGLVFSTLLGGSGVDCLYSARTDSAGDMIATGATGSANFPLTPASEGTGLPDEYDCFVIKLKSDGTQLLYSDFIGCADAYGLGLDSTENPFVVGTANAAGFPTTNGAYDRQFNGLSDAFVFYFRLPAPPLEPNNLSASPKDRQALLDWKAPLDDGYRPVGNYSIYRGTDIAALARVATVGNTTKYTDTGLNNGWKYYYAVSAINIVGEGILSGVANVTPGAAPTRPERLQATTGDRYVNLTWSRPNDIKGYPITGYSVHRGPDPSHLALLSALGNVTGFNDTSVSNGASYTYAVSAANDKGEGPFSDIINATPGRSPSAPANLTAETGNAVVLLKWDPPQDDGGYEIESFRIYQIDMDPETPVMEVQGISCTVEALENGRTYYYAVSAVNLKGEGEKCEEISVVPGAPPGAPSLTVQGLNGQVSLSWSIADDGGLPVALFCIYRAERSDMEPLLYKETSKTSFDDLFVLNEKTYYYAVSAVNSKGEGNKSAARSATPAGDGRLPGPPINVTVVAKDGYILISWNPPPDRGGFLSLGYRIYRGESEGSLSLLTDSPGLTFNDTQVINGNTYYYAISSVNPVGEGQRSAAVSARPAGEGRVPGPPLDFSLMRRNDSIMLNWSKPADYGGLVMIAYNIYRGTDESNLIPMGNTTELSYSDSSWEHGILYHYAVCAVNAKGPSVKSELKEIVIYDLPSEVQNVTAAAGNNFVLLSWQEPMEDGGYKIKEYHIFKAQGKGDLSFYISIQAFRFNDTKVTNGLNYSYKIAAVNDLGLGSFAGLLNATPGAPPNKPWNLEVGMENGKVRLKWDPPSDNGGFRILEYRIFRGSSEKGQKLLASVKEPTFLDDKAKEGGKYYYMVYAVNARGQSPSSDTISIFVPGTAGGLDTMLIISISAVIIISVVAIALVLRSKKKSSESKNEDNRDKKS